MKVNGIAWRLPGIKLDGAGLHSNVESTPAMHRLVACTGERCAPVPECTLARGARQWTRELRTSRLIGIGPVNSVAADGCVTVEQPL